MEMKRTHFKMYKSGRKWVFACAIVLAIGGGGVVTANADVQSGRSSSTPSVEQPTSRTTSSGNSGEASGDVSGQKQGSDTPDSNAKKVEEQQQNENKPDTNTNESKPDTGESDDNESNGSQDQQSSDQPSSPEKTPQKQRDTEVSSLKDSKQPTNNAKQRYNHTKSSEISLQSMSDHLKQVQNNLELREKINNLVERAQDKYLPAKTTALEPLAEAEIQAGGSVYDDYPDLDNLLGVSSVFHIFAREAELNAHTNGNVAVQNLIGNVNFGTSIIEELLDKDISYIQNITNIAGSSFVSKGDSRENKVVFGDGISIDISNPNRPMVNGVYIDHLLASEVYQDQNGQTYIDFDAEFAKLKALNESLANKKSEASYTNADFSDQNSRVIDVTDMTPNANGQIVLNLSPDVLQGNTPLTIKGLSPDEEGPTIIINVDTGGQEDYTINSQIKIIYSDGSERNNHETEHFGDNHLLWNFYDSTASDKQFGGTINVNAPFQGSMLAPSATIVANQNVDGNLIADKVIVNAETHRWDLQGNGDKDDEEEFEKPVHPGIDVELPNIEEPETPDPEEPDTEEPDTEEPDTEAPDEEENGDDEDLTYEHERPEYNEDEVVEDFWDDLIDDEEKAPSAARTSEEALLQRVDQAIAAAKAQGNTARVAQLEALKSRILADLGGLPQTGETQNKVAPAVGAVLLASLLGTLGAGIIRKRRN
ncbi:collagen-binding domain-containing protein [Levilactobacillus tujiorum]|uniref:KxYKxGKxW signal peptide domain-containing protein n=1 Tax=Levilactobacillus tujiorum TaxID=2912243 RepID=A0ABX1L5S7_9LACO|nr:collagen-binding domain-containing protein [Levilactobacillus tujiorum]MCH5464915.1 KxYKxGKxW signal peptide domain-containing protein [Levilactobacillus tujiorum]NLR12472.1 KxYKxGKxW signal peptide domain-containing protein [Lactobacillus sp. HBUAS51387]NLR30421.1 KxYKxGKxW signal peptide domain-containing protein [Levilactobacillus tujiorum]